MKNIILLLACLANMPLSAQAGELYRWVDSSGKIYYGDVPSTSAVRIEVKKFPDDIKSNEYMPYETRRAQQNFPVTLYVAEGCGETCNQARSLLSKRGIPYSEKQLRTKQDFEVFKQLSGLEGATPVLAVGKVFLKGFSSEQWNNELDIASYPKTAPYRTPGTPAASQVVPANPTAP